MRDEELKKKAEEIFQSMKGRGLQSGDIKYELRNRAFPPGIERKLSKMIEQKFNQ